MNFKKITINDKNLINKYFEKYTTEISEYTFTNLFCWRLTKKTEFCEYENHLVIRYENEGEKRFFQPFGPTPWTIIAKIINEDNDAIFERIDKQTVENLKSFTIIEDRNNFDYVYDIKELINLEGTKYAPKRNFIHRAKKLNPKIKIYSKEDIQNCLSLHETWCDIRDCKNNPSLNAEDLAIHEIFEQHDHLDIMGIVIYIDEKIAGFVIGEKLNNTMMVDHFEKADTKHPGIYQLLLNEFVKIIPNEYTTINREQDLGVEGLRKAKLSYNPIKLVEKYTVKK